MKSTCISCQADNITQLLDFGPQPPSNRYLGPDESVEDTHSLKFGICDSCSHIQLLDPMQVDMVQSRFDWITYNEPERHLDDVVLEFMKLPGIVRDSRILGITYKEDTTLKRLREHGFEDLYRISPNDDLCISEDAGLELIQDKFTPETAKSISGYRGKADLIYARHVLEHSHDPKAFTEALKILVKDDGYLVFEVPDSERFMRYMDYPFIWEEHISYFVEQNLREFLYQQDLSIVKLLRYSYTFEDSLVVITKVNDRSDKADVEYINHEDARYLAFNYAKNFPLIKNKIRCELKDHLDSGEKIGLFGAGHLAVKYLNFFGLSDLVHIVVDDNPNKQGLYMPGSGIPIENSSVLEKLDLCLLSLSPESEEKVLNKYQSFTDNGGEFRSIFAASPIAIVDTTDL